MVDPIISAAGLDEFIRKNRQEKLVVEFKAEWCQGSFVMKSAFQKLAIRYGQGNMKFASVDIVLAGIDLLNSIRADLNLGAIPSFYIYENNSLIDTLITCSTTKLNLFLKSHFFGNIKEDDNENRIDHKHSVKFNKEAHRRKSDKDEFNLRSSRKKDDSKDSTSQNSIQKINKIRMDPKYLQMEKRIMTALNANNVDKRITLDFFRSPSPKAKNKARKIIASNGRCQSELSNRSLTPKSRNEFLKKSELSVNRSPSPNVRYKASKKIALSGRCQSELSNRSLTPKSKNEFLKKSEPGIRCYSEASCYNVSDMKTKSILKRSSSSQFEIDSNKTSFDKTNCKYPERGFTPHVSLKQENNFFFKKTANNNHSDNMYDSSNSQCNKPFCFKTAQSERKTSIDQSSSMNSNRTLPSDILKKAKDKFFNIKVSNENYPNDKRKFFQLKRSQSYCSNQTPQSERKISFYI